MRQGTGLPTEVCEAAMTAAMNEVARRGNLNYLDHENPAGVECDLAFQLSQWAVRRAMRLAHATADDEEQPAA